MVFAFLFFHLEYIFYYSDPKHGKASQLSCFLLVPLSITSCVSKLFTLIVLSRLFFAVVKSGSSNCLITSQTVSPCRQISIIFSIFLLNSCVILLNTSLALVRTLDDLRCSINQALSQIHPLPMLTIGCGLQHILALFQTQCLMKLSSIQI